MFIVKIMHYGNSMTPYIGEPSPPMTWEDAIGIVNLFDEYRPYKGFAWIEPA